MTGESLTNSVATPRVFCLVETCETVSASVQIALWPKAALCCIVASVPAHVSATYDGPETPTNQSGSPVALK